MLEAQLMSVEDLMEVLLEERLMFLEELLEQELLPSEDQELAVLLEVQFMEVQSTVVLLLLLVHQFMEELPLSEEDLDHQELALPIRLVQLLEEELSMTDCCHQEPFNIIDYKTMF